MPTTISGSAPAYSHIGRVHDAIAVARNLVEQPRDPQKNNIHDGSSAQRSGRIRWSEILSRYELWDDLIAATTSARSTGRTSRSSVRRKLTPWARPTRPANDQQKPGQADRGDPQDRWSPRRKAGLAELEGYALLAKDESAGAFEQFAKARSMRTEALARAHLAARNYRIRRERRAAGRGADSPIRFRPSPPWSRSSTPRQGQGSREAYRRLEPLARWADRDLPVLRRLEPIVARW